MTQVEVEVGMDVHLILWLVLRAHDDTHSTHTRRCYVHTRGTYT